MGRGCYLFYLCSKETFFNRSKAYCIKSPYVHQISQAKLVSGVLIQIISSKVIQESTTILQLKVYIAYVMRKLVLHPPEQECPINLVLFLFPFVCNARSLDHQFFLFFPISHHNVRKKMDPNF